MTTPEVYQLILRKQDDLSQKNDDLAESLDMLHADLMEVKLELAGLRAVNKFKGALWSGLMGLMGALVPIVAGYFLK